jgi:hypothetical protein
MDSFVYATGVVTLWVLVILLLCAVCWGPIVWHEARLERKHVAEQELALRVRLNLWATMGVPCDAAGNPVSRFGHVLHGQAEVAAHWPPVDMHQYVALLDAPAPELACECDACSEDDLRTIDSDRWNRPEKYAARQAALHNNR